MNTVIPINGSAKKELDPSGLSIPFPGWINRWALLIMGICIAVPVCLFIFIHQPVYVQTPAQLMDKNETLFVSNVPSSIASLNLEGQTVDLTINLPASQKREKGKGFVRSILLKGNSAQVIIEPDAELKKYLDQLGKEDSKNAQVLVHLKSGERNMVRKIFN